MAKTKLFAAVFFFSAVTGWSATLFDCNDPAQRLTCAEPAEPGKRFVCHATGSTTNPYVKIKVSQNSSHVPGVAHGPNSRADQAPGASGNDVGSGAGLDCECNDRICESVCTGAATGTPCDDANLCTGEGSCLEGVCQPGEPTCVAGAPIDACNDQTGACDSRTGECMTAPLPPGTLCGPGRACDANGACVDLHVVINEVESSGGVPGDWVELFNAGTFVANVSGWRFLDNDDTHTAYVIPAGTLIAPGGYLVLEEAQFGFGLGSADSARLFNPAGALVDSYSWTSHAVTTYGRCPNGSGAFKTTTASTKGTANDCSVAVKINEIESSGGSPGDWVELLNAGPIAVDISGWIFKDNDDTHSYVIPSGTTMSAGAYYLLEEAAFGFGLGSADAARLYDSGNALIDSFFWTSHAATTYGRCPNGSGSFTTTASPTKGAANACGSGSSDAAPWPGRNNVTTVDGTNVFGGNLSDLFYEPTATSNVLWAVRNGPSTLYRLVWNGSIWTPETANAWDTGKNLHYTDGTGSPDAEGVTRAELSSSAVYVATERDNDVSAVSRPSVLRFDGAAAGAELTATHEWNLSSDLPAVGSNLGLEAITWVPDTFLVAHSFFDEGAGHTYLPVEYPNHGTGIFFVGLEANGTIYAYALDHLTGGFRRLATIASFNATIKGLAFDRDTGYLWSICGAACANEEDILRIDTTPASPTFGRFKLAQRFARPSTMPNISNEGIAVAPESQCASGFKAFWWADDSETGGHAIRADTIPCGAFIP